MHLIAVDLDDTLLRRDKTISSYTLDVLARCQAKGIMIAFATARNECNALNHIEEVHPDAVISAGGGIVRFRGEIVDIHEFSQDETQALLDAGRALVHGEPRITMDTVDAHYRNFRGEDENDWGNITEVDFRSFQSSAIKMCLKLPAPDVAAQAAAALPGCDWLRFYGTDWYCFTRPGITKHSALARLAQYLDLTTQDVIAFGDDYGDIGMIRESGIGVAMGNAIDEVKQAADVICEDCDRDGVARELERRFL